MKKATFFILFVFLLCFRTVSFSQTLENSLLRAFVEILQQQDQDFHIKKMISGTEILEDPATGEVEISYGKNSAAMQEYKKLTKQRQLEILKVPELTIFPLKNTISLVDSTSIFSNGVNINIADKFLKVVQTKPIKSGTTEIFINRILIRGDEVFLELSFTNNAEFYIYGFKMEKDRFTFTESLRSEKLSYE